MENHSFTPANFGMTKGKGKKKAPRVKNRRPKKIEIDPQAHMIKRIASCIWPGEEANKELEFHQRNYIYCIQLYRRLKALQVKLTKEAADKDMQVHKRKSLKSSQHWFLPRIVEYLHCTMAGPIDMSVWWATEVNRTAWNWSGWKGKILDWVLSDDTPALNQLMSRMVADQCEDARPWQAIRKLLKADNK